MALQESLKERKDRLDYGLTLVQRTREFYDGYGGEILRTKYDRFADIEKGLRSQDVRMVVIGEFSRGKSSLLNALLGISRLPTANEATTAINCFVHGLPEGEQTPHLSIRRCDGTVERIDLLSEDQDELRKWGTELDGQHRDARQDVESIEMFISHPLLDLGLVLIDTPGLESMQKHHEAITHRAIDSAHIAIWVQAATQLGGNKREWAFLTDTIRKSFNKFLTVINFWDLVLDPQDEQDRGMPDSIRISKKMNIVRGRFAEALGDNVSAQDLAQMTDDDHLFGVSARWALHGTEEQRKQSGLDKLERRIAAILKNNEAQDEIFFKPIRQLASMQDALIEHVQESRSALDNTDSIEKQERDIERLDMEIRNLELERDNANMEVARENDEQKKYRIRVIIDDLSQPMRELKEKIELLVTPDYVRGQIEKRVEKIGLPADLHREYHDTVEMVRKKLERQKDEILNVLSEMATSYRESMNRNAGKLEEALHDVNIVLPDMDVGFQMDFCVLDEFYEKKLSIESDIARYEQEIANIENEIAINAARTESLNEARRSVDSARQRLIDLGGIPSPVKYTTHERIKKGGTYSSDVYGPVEHTDSTNVEEWKRQKMELDEEIRNKEDRIQALIREEEVRTGVRMRYEAAKRRVEQEIRKKERLIEDMGAAAARASENLVETTHRQLLANTAGQLDQRIRFLETNVAEAVARIFDDHLAGLRQCVEEQFVEPLKARRQGREQAREAIAKGREELEAHIRKLDGALDGLRRLKEETEGCLC